MKHLNMVWKRYRTVGYWHKETQRGFYKDLEEPSTEFKEYNDKHLTKVYYNSILSADILQLIFEYAPMDLVKAEESIVAKSVHRIYLYSTIYGILTYIMTGINLYIIATHIVYR